MKDRNAKLSENFKRYNIPAIVLSAAWLAMALVEIGIVSGRIGSKGIGAMLRTQMAIAVLLVAVACLIFLLFKRKYANVWLVGSLIVGVAGSLAEIGQWGPRCFIESAPNHYATFAANKGLFYRIDILHGEFPDLVMSVQGSSVVVNIALILASVLLITNLAIMLYRIGRDSKRTV